MEGRSSSYEERWPILLEKESEVGLIKEFSRESKTLWQIAGPIIFSAICQTSLGSLTQIFAGFIGDLDQAAVTVAVCVFSPLTLGIMVGLASAFETLCGQAFGAGDLKMMGIYMQRSWVILLAAACLFLPMYIFTTPILLFFGHPLDISQLSGKFVWWMTPQLFAFAMYFPPQKFLQAQGKVMVLAWQSFIVLVFHVSFSWLLMFKLGWGLAGAAIVLNSSWWLLVIGQVLYIFITTSDGAWCGFSWLAFTDLWDFVKLSFASAVMLCVELCYYSMTVVIAGHLANPLIPVDALGICLSIEGWAVMIAFGFNAAISVRVSNELGAGNHRQAKIATVVASITSVTIGVILFVTVLATREYFPRLFTASEAVGNEITRISILLSFTLLLNSLQPVLSGVAVGAGWQSLFAYINVGCFYLVGLPTGILLGFTFDLGVMGIWGGMIGGVFLQTIVLVVVTSLTNWKKEANEAESRVQKWGESVIADVQDGSTA